MDLRKIRTKKNISQNQLSKLSGIAQSSISYIESGDKSPSINTVNKLAKALNMSVAELLE